MTVQEKLKCLDFIIKLCIDSNTYLDTDFGAKNCKLYIDGCLEYENIEQKELIKTLFNEYKNKL